MNRCQLRIAGTAVLFLILAFLPSRITAQDEKPAETIWLVVRHAERDGQEDAITDAGRTRADLLSQLAKTFRVSAVYSTDTTRTRDTASPTAKQLNLEIQSYAALTPKWFEQIKSRHGGQVVLIVGHSNTCGPIVEGLAGKGNCRISEDEYENLFVVSTGGKESSVIRMRFGAKDRKQ